MLSTCSHSLERKKNLKIYVRNRTEITKELKRQSLYLKPTKETRKASTKLLPIKDMKIIKS